MSEENKVEAKSTIEIIESIKETEEFKTLLENHAKSNWESKIGGEVKSIYSNIDSKAKEALGADKPDNVKTSDWVYNNLVKGQEALKQLEVLKSKGDTNAEQEKLWQAKYKKLSDDLKAKESTISSLTEKGFQNNISNKLDNYLALKTFNAVYAESELKDIVDVRKSRIINSAKKLDNGKTVYYEPGTDKPYLDTLGEPMTLNAVASIHFQSLFEAKTPGGSADDKTTTAVNKGDVIAMNMGDIKTKQDFFKEFQKNIAPKGLASHEENYLKIQRATMEHYKINSLPLA